MQEMSKYGVHSCHISLLDFTQSCLMFVSVIAMVTLVSDTHLKAAVMAASSILKLDVVD